MDIKDIQLNGNNLCNIECVDKNAILHPETDTDQILISNSNISINEWFGNSASGSFADYDSMIEWLENNYSITEYSLPTASNSTLGGIKVGNYLTISNGILSVNKASLGIPTLNNATFSTSGIIKLGNNTQLAFNFEDTSITDVNVTYFPLRLDGNNRAGIAIPDACFSQVQVDWNNTNPQSKSYIVNKPNLKIVATSGSYNDLIDKPTIPSKISDLTNDSDFLTSVYWEDILNKPIFSSVATSGLYSDLSGKPELSTVATSGNYTDLSNKPNLATVATSGIYDDLLNKPDILSPSELTNYYTKEEVDNKLTSAMRYKGTVADYSALIAIVNPSVGDVYHIETGGEYIWNGTSWDYLGNMLSIDALSASSHNTTESYTVKGSGYTGSATKYLKEDGSWAIPTNTTYSAATDTTLGLIKTNYSTTEQNKAVKVDEYGNAYVQLKTPVGAWISNGMSQHYFRTETETEHYIPLMDIEMPSGYEDKFKINVLFRIISRHGAHYSGTFYINIKNRDEQSYGAIIASDVVSDTINGVPYLKPDDIKVCFTNNDETSARIYRKKAANTIGNASHEGESADVFIVDVLGNNDYDENHNKINNITYFCTKRFNEEESVISIFPNSITPSNKFIYVYNDNQPSSGVTSVTAGIGLNGGTITSTGTINTNLNSNTSLGTIGVTDNLYAVGIDSTNKLCVSVPNNSQTYTAGSNIQISQSNVISATDTTYNKATNNTFGLVKIGSWEENGVMPVVFGSSSGHTDFLQVSTPDCNIFCNISENTEESTLRSYEEAIKNALRVNFVPNVIINYDVTQADNEGIYGLCTLLKDILNFSNINKKKIVLYIISNDTVSGRISLTRTYDTYFNNTMYQNNSARANCVISGSTLTVYRNTCVKIEAFYPENLQTLNPIFFISTYER